MALLQERVGEFYFYTDSFLQKNVIPYVGMTVKYDLGYFQKGNRAINILVDEKNHNKPQGISSTPIIQQIKCPNCNGNIKLDFDNLASYCPYCASPLTIDLSVVKDVLLEKEKTRRFLGKEELKFQKEIVEEKNTALLSILLIGVLGLCVIALVIIILLM